MDTDGLKREIREKIPSGSRICFLRSDHGRDVGDLSDEFQVLDIPIYRVERLPCDCTKIRNSWGGVLVTSSFEAQALSECMRECGATPMVFAIGPPTAATLRSMGIEPSEPIGKSDIGGLIKEIEELYGE